MTTEAKVGAFTLAGLALFAGVVIMLSGFKLGGDKGYTLYAGFKQVVGIEPQSLVRLSGVPVGSVESVNNDGRGVTVTMRINSDVKIPQNSQVVVGAAGVMGDKFINILPGDDNNGWVEDGDYLQGQDEVGMDDMMQSMIKLAAEAQNLLEGMNKVIGNGDFQASFIQMAINMRDTTAHIKGMMAALENIAVSNQSNISQLLGNLNMATGSLNRTMNSVEAMMANLATVGADPQTAENLRLTLDNIAKSSEQIRIITEGVAKIAGDEKTVEDTKKIIHNARELTEKAKDVKKQLDSIKTEASVDVLYSGGRKDWETNLNFMVGMEQGPFLNMGVEDIGEHNRMNFQVGSRRGSLAARAGAIHGEAGVGLDAYAGKNFKLSADAYKFNDFSLRLGAQYRIAGDTWLMGQWRDVNHSDRRAAYIGLKQAF
ncbi:MAG: MCE family protein [Selenomonas sp.]|nr:MCE family protein [Selenomonas sp.]MBQ5420443.1 MCE family protein [Selenomonas sp.]